MLEDHSPVGGLADGLQRELKVAITAWGVEGWPACGTPAEGLRFHRLGDGASTPVRLEPVLGLPAWA